MSYTTTLLLVFIAGVFTGWYLDIIGKLWLKQTERHNRRKEDRKLNK